MTKNRSIAIILFLIFGVACSSLQRQSAVQDPLAFDHVSLGSDEAQVKSLMGPPGEEVRLDSDGSDHWLYTMKSGTSSRMFATFHFNTQKKLISKALEWPAVESLNTLADVDRHYQISDFNAVVQTDRCPYHTHMTLDKVYLSNSRGLSASIDAHDGHVTRLSWDTLEVRKSASVGRNQKTCPGYEAMSANAK